LTSPFAAQIERVNPNLLSDLNEQKISNTRKVWFLKLKVDHLDKKLINLPSGEKALHFLQNQQSNLLSHIMNVLQKEKYIPNHTLQDGGEYIQDLEKVLGPNRYFQLVSSILS
jgi:hypothetical protein